MQTKKKKPITKKDNFDRNYMRHLVEEDEENLFRCLQEAEPNQPKKEKRIP